jgi:hypothetical protein
MTVFGDASDPALLGAELGLLTLARRLGALGFELTMFGGVTEHADGRVTVEGRSGEDTIVVVGVAATAPFVFPFTNRAPWTLASEPVFVAVPSMGNVTLAASPAPRANDKKKRVIVFRGKMPH